MSTLEHKQDHRERVIQSHRALSSKQDLRRRDRMLDTERPRTRAEAITNDAGTFSTLIESRQSASDFSGPNIEDFLQTVARSPASALLLDFDGTLAPFRVDPVKVRPWAGVRELLEGIRDSGRTRIAIITGRPAADAQSLLGMRVPLEIWGSHGAERLSPDGQLDQQELPLLQIQGLSAARDAVHAAAQTQDRRSHPDFRIEAKWNAVAVHWRGQSARSAQLAQRRAMDMLCPIAEERGLHLLQFDGGIEVRAGRNKGDAVWLLMGEMHDHAPVAYLGDDTTDEDAFQALTGKGLPVLVRREWRPGAAHAWLRPPSELRRFLAAWLSAVKAG